MSLANGVVSLTGLLGIFGATAAQQAGTVWDPKGEDIYVPSEDYRACKESTWIVELPASGISKRPGDIRPWVHLKHYCETIECAKVVSQLRVWPDNDSKKPLDLVSSTYCEPGGLCKHWLSQKRINRLWDDEIFEIDTRYRLSNLIAPYNQNIKTAPSTKQLYYMVSLSQASDWECTTQAYDNLNIKSLTYGKNWCNTGVISNQCTRTSTWYNW